MPGNNFTFQRHLKIWEDQNKQIKRAVFAAFVFCVLLSVRVLKPFAEVTQSAGEYNEKITAAKQKLEQIAKLDSSLEKIERSLQEVQNEISSEPWQAQKDSLIGEIRSIRNSAPMREWDDRFQKAADRTINKIAMMVQEKVVAPLDKAIAENQELRAARPEIAESPGKLRSQMQNWQQKHVGERWWGTLQSKALEMDRLTGELQARIDSVRAVLEAEQARLKYQRAKLLQEAKALTSDIRRYEQALANLEPALQKLLPEWLRDILTVKLAVQILPLLTIGFVLYIVGLGLLLSRHFSFVAQALELDEIQKKDLSVSSVWTLTDRGLLGNVMTLLLYATIILVSWLFFEWTGSMLAAWIAGDAAPGWYLSGFTLIALRWVGRAAFVGALGFVVYRLFRSKIVVS